MAAKTRLTPFDGQNGDAFDEEASVSRIHVLPLDAIDCETAASLRRNPCRCFSRTMPTSPEPPSFRKRRSGYRRTVSPRIIFRAGLLAAAAAAFCLALVSVENPLALFANAKASLIGASAGQPSAGQTKSAAAPVPAERLASISPSSPTRDEIAAASGLPARSRPRSRLKSVAATCRPAGDRRSAGNRRQPVIAAPAGIAAPPARRPAVRAPQVRRLDPDELAALLKRAKSLIAVGDIAPARLLLERAADAQEASAALLLAQTYDPGVLGTQDMRSITPDPAKARDWYREGSPVWFTGRSAAPQLKCRISFHQRRGT